MSLGNRHSAHHDTSAMRRLAGVDETVYWDFTPGQRVTVKEGYQGRVTEVLSGPVGGAEIYMVTLDGGMGGGEYSASELAAEGEQVPNTLGATAARQDSEEDDEDLLGSPHIASEDYPVLAEILVDRPPLAHSVTAGIKTAGPYDFEIIPGEEDEPNMARRRALIDRMREDLDAYLSNRRAQPSWEKHPGGLGWRVLLPTLDYLVLDPNLLGGFEASIIDQHHRRSRESEEFYGVDVPTAVRKALQLAVRFVGWKWYSPAERRKRGLETESSWVVQDESGKNVYGPTDSSFEAKDASEQIEGQTSVEQVVDQQAFQGWGNGNNAEAETETSVHIGGFFDKTKWSPGGNWSYDWCRFRRNERCYYPKELNYEATKEMGYAVWIPRDRGFCSRAKWEDQKACPIAEPGPNSGDPNALLDATIPYSEGGQRGGIPVRASRSDLAAEESLVAEASRDPEFGFHFTAAWTDVQRKARRIRSGGGVRILSALPNSITAEVRGDSAVYQTRITRQPGRKAVAMWECGCAWSSYSWGRSGRWKRYEGRMCSHALALSYEAQSQEWGDGEVQEQAEAPEWSRGVKPKVDQRSRPSAWQIGQPRRASLKVHALPAIEVNPTVDDIVNWYLRVAADEEPKTTRLFQDIAKRNMGEMEGLQFRRKAPDSLRRKVENKILSERGDPRQWINDALRYTVVFHPSVYSAQVQDYLYALEEAGYRIEREENSWRRGDSYSALHYTLRSPRGAPIELQFHTGESHKLKSETLHKLYEEFRETRTPLHRKRELYDLMVGYWDDVEVPDGVLNFPDPKWYPKPAVLNPDLHPSLASAIQAARRTDGVWVRFRGRLHKLIALLPGRNVQLKGDIMASVHDIVYAGWDPTAGLNFTGAKAPQGMPGLEGAQEVVASMDEDLWSPGSEAVLRDEPGPALPSTTAIEEDDIEAVGSAGTMNSGLEWLMGSSGGDSDIANGAKEFLAKSAAKQFSAAEQQEIINEGEGVLAANFGRLDIAGTHYETLEEITDDDGQLW